MNADIEVGFWKDEDAEKADITIRSFGGVSELSFEGKQLNAVASMSPADIHRLLECFIIAEGKRVDPDPQMLESLEYVKNRLHCYDDDQSQLWINCKMVMPIASCGSVRLVPNFKDDELSEDETEV